MADRAILNRMLKIPLLFLIVFTASTGCAIVHNYGEYYGKVIDTETKEPLEGAAVLAVYYTEQPGPAGSVSHYVDAQETVTDKNGEFRISSTVITAFRPLQYFYSLPNFKIFKPGYGCYPDYKGIKHVFSPAWSLPADKYVVIELPKLKTREEKIESTHCSPDSDVPYLKAKKFIDLINKENKSLGLGIERYE